MVTKLWEDCSCAMGFDRPEGREFLEPQYAFGTSAFLDLLKELNRMGETYILYNEQIPRHEPGVTPFDLTSTKWAGCRFAPAWDADCDPVVADQKSRLFGHR